MTRLSHYLEREDGSVDEDTFILTKDDKEAGLRKEEMELQSEEGSLTSFSENWTACARYHAGWS